MKRDSYADYAEHAKPLMRGIDRLPRAKNPMSETERSRRFIEKARELGGDTDQAAAEGEQTLRKIVKPKTEPPKKAG